MFDLVSLWKLPQVIFDSDPAPAGVAPNAQMEQMGQAMIRFEPSSLTLIGEQS